MKHKTPIHAVLFDLDGVLVDSEGLYYEVDRELLSEYGIQLTFEDNLRYVGGSNLEMMRDLVSRYALPLSVEALLSKQTERYLRAAREKLKPFYEMQRAVSALHREGMPMAVASGSSRTIIEEVLSLTGLKEFFPLYVSSDEVGKGKPDPGVFLLASQRLGVLPEECCVVEDSLYGVQAAFNAKMACLAIPGRDVPLERDFRKADLLFEGGMEDFTCEVFLAWIKGRNE